MAVSESIESDSGPKIGPTISVSVKFSAPESTAIDGTANATATMDTIAVATHTLARSGTRKIKATDRVRNNKR